MVVKLFSLQKEKQIFKETDNNEDSTSFHRAFHCLDQATPTRSTWRQRFKMHRLRVGPNVHQNTNRHNFCACSKCIGVVLKSIKGKRRERIHKQSPVVAMVSPSLSHVSINECKRRLVFSWAKYFFVAILHKYHHLSQSSQEEKLDCALDLMRRLPPQQIEKNLSDLIDLVSNSIEYNSKCWVHVLQLQHMTSNVLEACCMSQCVIFVSMFHVCTCIVELGELVSFHFHNVW